MVSTEPKQDEYLGQLSHWQQARRRRRAWVDRLMSVLFGALAIAAVLYFIALGSIIAPVLVGR